MSIKIALQLYTVRDQTAQNFVETVRKVAALGYDGIEFAGYGDLSAPDLRALLDETGLIPLSSHISLADLSNRLDAVIEYCQAIGCKTIVLPWLEADLRTPEYLKELAPRLNAIGAECRKHDITLAYHNHDFEFSVFNDQTLLASLLELTDPKLVKIELDAYWAAYAGHDPIALLDTLGDRVALIHFKDLAADRSMTEVGAGTLDIQKMIAFALQHNLWAIVENDFPQIPSLESARLSLAYLRK